MRHLGAIPLALLFAGSYDAVNLRTTPPEGPSVARVVKAPVLHTVLAKAASDTETNATLQANATSSSNNTGVFRLADYGPAIGKVFALYYSTVSGQKATQIEARNYKALAQAPSDPVVFNPETGQTLAQVKGCNLRLKSVNYLTDWRKYNMRMAEVAVCERSFGSPCGANAKGCEIELFAPLPYDSKQEPYIGAGMALTVNSLLCKQRTESWKQASCNLERNKAAIAAGLQQTSSGIALKPINGALTDLKMDATYELAFQEAVFADANRQHYEESDHYEKKDDVLAWSRTPPTASFCKDLSCLVAKFQTR